MMMFMFKAKYKACVQNFSLNHLNYRMLNPHTTVNSSTITCITCMLVTPKNKVSWMYVTNEAY